MRLGRLAVAGLTAGVIAGFVIALLLPRRRRTVLDLTAVEVDTVVHPDQSMLHVEPDSPTSTAVEQP